MKHDLKTLVSRKKVGIVGIGNRLRGDDAVGSILAEWLAGQVPALILDAETVPENYLDRLKTEQPDIVLFLDTADWGGQPGEWCLAPLEALTDKLPSTHTLSVKLIGHVLQAQNIECWLLAIQPAQLDFGAAVSSPVAKAGGQIFRLLIQALG